ncbi:MAG: ribosome maturation factor RimM [Acidimicrobiia bacterium]
MIGRLGRPHGLDGFLGLYVDDEDIVSVQPGATVFVGDRQHCVRAVRKVDRGYQVAFEDVADREGAEELRGLDVSVSERRQLSEGEFWPDDLIGLAVFDDTGQPLGVVKEVLFGPGQERLVVERVTGGTFEVPFVGDLVPLVDREAERVEIVAIPGLIEPSG